MDRGYPLWPPTVLAFFSPGLEGEEPFPRRRWCPSRSRQAGEGRQTEGRAGSGRENDSSTRLGWGEKGEELTLPQEQGLP